ncbi:phosphate signaling complex protein PhoU [Rhodopirellula sp. MGV]|uniref:phosphate signaling complex protein PhoU n=1 Tax=Rhodopirellula sp. MGV TaxID=2023130 RepID=UPI000B969404|nr:phosphate signaling complex protein PhoU [Rhodopirellula sp. MGV]OYP32377.1 phosphate transport system regulatory protein PhoU [Rhodopirellula sp. MGV]PNY35838.1 phosphate transport system regulatory protein PhoU [Rhodopirellula baltica]
MSKHLERELEHLREQLISQFTVVEQMIQLAVRSLVERRPDFADRVLESDVAVDEMDVRIEEECLKVLALHQPVAFDMRYLISVDKVNGELERMGDTACNIAERAKALCKFPLFTVPDELSEMVDTSIKMVRQALDSFINCDSRMANEVIQMDDIVDALNRVVIDQLQEVMKSDRELIEPAVHCFSASRHLERIGDLAECVCEEVIYLVEGEIVRHKHGWIREVKKRGETNVS